MKTNLPDNTIHYSRRFQAASRAFIGVLLVFMLGAPLVAAPVTRNEAFRAAASQLPGFFAGAWQPAGELTLQGLAGGTGAFVFIFANGLENAKETPAAFVSRQRAGLAASGKGASADTSELYGEDRYATIFISAEDTEPVVLRCFKGLPAQIVKEADALALAAKAAGNAWRVRRCLALGAFDEAFVLDPTASTGQALVVDMRTRSVVTEEDAKARAKAKPAPAPDPERIRLCQAAWAPYRAGDTATPQARAVSGAPPKNGSVTAGSSKKQAPVQGPQGK
jgi:hypothetical protein